MDTGCGHDLIGRAKAKSLGVDIVKDDDEIVFQTANGSTSTSDVAKIVVDELDETVEPHVLDETPTVLSVGRRCVKTLLAPCLNWEAVLRSVFVLLTRFH